MFRGSWSEQKAPDTRYVTHLVANMVIQDARQTGRTLFDHAREPVPLLDEASSIISNHSL
jgi:hypothetical protein